MDSYVRSRPSYPPALFDLFETELGLKPSDTVVDLGSGTGLLTAPFLARGNPVYAVEPNAAMREAAEATFGDHPAFESVDGTAEATGLPAGVARFVVAGQAFHWFDPVEAAVECRRVLAADGLAVIVWNHRRVGGTPFLVDYERFLRTWGTDYEQVNPRHADSQTLATFFRGSFEDRSFPNHQDLDAEGLRARFTSSSYLPGPADPKHAEMMRAVSELFERHAVDGAVRLEYDTLTFWGRP